MATTSRYIRVHRGGARTAVVGAILAVIASATAVVISTGPAHAAVPCPTSPGIVWELIGPRPPTYRAFVYTTRTVTPTFNVSDARTVVNTLDTPVSATFTSQHSTTYSLQVTAGS